MTRPEKRPAAPCPEQIRRIPKTFTWLDTRLLREGWLARIGSDALSTLCFLVLASDERGTSYWGRDRMAQTLALERQILDRALNKLLNVGLIAHRPWREGSPDGVWQVLPVPEAEKAKPRGGAVDIATLLGELRLRKRS